MQLSERLAAIVSLIGQDETVGDIGADHAYIPIFLWSRRITGRIIVSDLNAGPLQKAAESIQRALGENPFEMRQSNGLERFQPGELDTAVIAGMGGLLIRDILAAYPDTARSVKKFILQPRNAQTKLRKWLCASGFVIYDEILAKEGRCICEIIAARPGEAVSCAGRDAAYEISPLLLQKKDPLLADFIWNKIEIELAIGQKTKEKHPARYAAALRRIEDLTALWQEASQAYGRQPPSAGA